MQWKARLDRQLRIEGWDQRALEAARIGVVGDDDRLASLYVMSASALGLNHLVVIAPRLDDALLEAAQKVNPELDLTLIEGFYTHPVLDDIFAGCQAIVDLSRYGLANKLLLEKGYREHIPIIRGFCYEQNGEQGFKVFTYLRGREWLELEELVSSHHLPGASVDEGVLDMIAAGIIVEETKNLLMGQRVSEEVITYKRKKMAAIPRESVICVVGAGALGNFVGLGLAYSGFRNITFMDPDVVEVTNLNRQVFLADGVGLSKAAILSERLNHLYGIRAQPNVAFFNEETDISPYDVIFDCVDNFETRIVLSEKCKAQNKPLISGGTNPDAGQVVVYDPAQSHGTPAEQLGLYEIVAERKIESNYQERAACTYRVDPSVIMANQIIGGIMVDTYRILLDSQVTLNVFYESTSDKKISVMC